MIDNIVIPCLLAAFYIALVGYIISAALDLNTVRNFIEEFWFTVNVEKKIIEKKHKLEAIYSLVQSLYLKDEKISYLKLAAIAFVMNASAAISLILITIADPEINIQEDMEEFSYPILVLLSLIGVYFNEYIAVKIFVSQYRKSLETEKLRYLAFGFLKIGFWLIIVFPIFMVLVSYIVALAFEYPSEDMFVYSIAPTQLLAILTVIFSYTMEETRNFGLIALPAALSIYLPLGVLMLGVLIFRSGWVLRNLSVAIDSKLYSQMTAIKRFCFGLVCLLGTVISVIAYHISR